MTHRSLFALLGMSLLAANLAQGASPADCAAEYSQIAEKNGKAALARLEQKQPGTPAFLSRIRDRIRRKLQVMHQHSYPIVAMDDATPVKAYSLAADNFGTLTQEQAKLIDLADIKREINDLLSKVEAFPSNRQTFLDETATLEARAEAIDDFLAANPKSDGKYFVDLDLPQAAVGKNGEVTISMVKERFTDQAQLEIARDLARRTLKERLGAKFFSLNGLDSFVMDQALRIKKLETYRNEIDRQMRLAINKDKPVSAELKGYFDRVTALFTNPEGRELKPEFWLPPWSNEKMHRTQLVAELRSIVQKDIPRLKDKVESNEVIKFLKTLPVEEQRALGIGNLAQSTSLLGKTKWGQLFAATAGGATFAGAPALYGLDHFYELFIADAKAKELCAAITSDDQFRTCVIEYLQQKFPVKALTEILANQQAFLDPNGKITDPEIAKQLKDIFERRKRIVETMNFKDNSRESLSKALQLLMKEHDQTSTIYRQRIVESAESEVFKMGLVGNKEPKIRSYLEFRYPVDFPRYKNTVVEILNMEIGSSEQDLALRNLRENGPQSLSDELGRLLRERQNFLRNGPSGMPSVMPGSGGYNGGGYNGGGYNGGGYNGGNNGGRYQPWPPPKNNGGSNPWSPNQSPRDFSPSPMTPGQMPPGQISPGQTPPAQSPGQIFPQQDQRPPASIPIPQQDQRPPASIQFPPQ
jgi:hypothetical protein